MSDAECGVLVAGCGYLGRALAMRLRNLGRNVVGLTHSAKSAEKLAAEAPFRVEACDLGSSAEIAQLAEKIPPPTCIFHCASSGRRGIDAYRQVYLRGCENLAETFAESPIFFTSSTSVYPQTNGEVVTETSPAEPNRETGKILRLAEKVALSRGGTVLRLAGIYGPGRSVLLQRFHDGTAVIETGPSRFLNQIHRDDAVSAFITLMDHPKTARGEIFNVSDGQPATQRATYEALADHFSRPVPPEAPPDPNRKRGWTHKQVSNAKLRALGWEPAYPAFLDFVRKLT